MEEEARISEADFKNAFDFRRKDPKVTEHRFVTWS